MSGLGWVPATSLRDNRYFVSKKVYPGWRAKVWNCPAVESGGELPPAAAEDTDIVFVMDCHWFVSAKVVDRAANAR